VRIQSNILGLLTSGQHEADAGRLAIFLASEDSRYIIGQTIVLDGGQSSIQQLD